MEGTNTVMIFYATSLSSSVGPYYQPPSLVCLANQWFDGSSKCLMYIVKECPLIHLKTRFGRRLDSSSIMLLHAFLTKKPPQSLINGNIIVRKCIHQIYSLIAYKSRPVPCLQPSADREATHAALALFLCGYLASEKYSLLSTRFGLQQHTYKSLIAL